MLERLNLRIDPDERMALLGRNGNGKTTLARLLAAQLPAMAGAMNASAKMKVGYFTQYQVEELDADDTPLAHMTRSMKGATPAAVRAQLGRFGFSGDRALARVGTMSGGEKARLALALITRDAPHLLILDEPTNHLDVDAREALVQALAAYEGAVVVVSHDRHMLELAADRLVLVDGGTASDFDGTLSDYTAMVLAKDTAAGDKAGGRSSRKEERRAAAEAREKNQALRRRLESLEKELAKLGQERSALDRAMFDPTGADARLTKLTMTELMKLRAAAQAKLDAVEAEWLELGEALETVPA